MTESLEKRVISCGRVESGIYTWSGTDRNEAGEKLYSNHQARHIIGMTSKTYLILELLLDASREQPIEVK